MRRLGYRPELDGVRGVAILVVVVGHMFAGRGAVFENAGRGVDIFFVLSGFLITALLLEGRYPSLRSFYAARARRLLPALALTLVVYLAVAHDHRALVASSLTAGYVANFALAFAHFSTMAALKHTWSLAAEEQFYLVWPAVLLVALRGNRRVAVCLLILALCAVQIETDLLFHSGMSGYRLAEGPDTRSVGILTGCLLALTLRRVAAVGRMLAPVALLLVADGILHPHFALYPNGLLAFCLSVAVLLAVALNGGWLGRVLSTRALTSLGRISYSLYLYHYPLLIAFGAYLSGRTGVKVAAVALSVMLAALSTRLVEQPIREKASSRVLARVKARCAEPAVADSASA